MSIYKIKPLFQNALRPLVTKLYKNGITANQVTVTACLVSVFIGFALFFMPLPRGAFLLLPIWFFIRMAFNAIDGMLAREFGQQSKLGAVLNELTDVISDAALYLPLAIIQPFQAFWIACVIILSIISEFIGVQAVTIGASRRYDGPMGKSDRAFVFGALGLWIGLTDKLPQWSSWILPVLALMVVLTIINRATKALQEARSI
ncbi:CDP-alcohol phosphatidyltransferase family protein [Hydromonas duriensis]|uniref:CDP-diacylglycerol--glycerol-3-phosphate 3-phosphatidyltransferase n=1 Tax=Hydromonas duriensis TaxID=1527608 RepID=A0A4R6YBV8_9BURK|nr:CDP-alcohol phosphatidyltransferase family protein [Hydromonas duriensis]TDR33084.1 CDP-diacylglycerol--glycerol-3-phosphate 3-phosphatidyltransferase [Hydromonas duriensis]